MPPPTCACTTESYGDDGNGDDDYDDEGGVIVVVVIRVRAPHDGKEMPGIIVVSMGEDDRPSPTTTSHVLPLW